MGISGPTTGPAMPAMGWLSGGQDDDRSLAAAGRYDSAARSRPLQECVDDERGQAVRVLCGGILLRVGPVDGFAEEGVVHLPRPLQICVRGEQPLALRPGS